MNSFLLISFFIIGTILGSFFNVVGLRVPNGKSIIYPSSHCPNCNHELKWYELIPVFSYIFLRGKCHNCHKPISIMYPLIELFTGTLFMISFYSFGFSYDLVISLTISSLLVLIIVSDLSYMIIPDSFTIIASIIIIVMQFFKYGLDGILYILYGIIAFSILYIIMYVSSKILKKESLGGGDIKLFFVVGLLFNPIMSLLVLAIASFIALPISLVLYFKNREHIIPFGPFIALATIFLFFTKINFNQIIEFLKK